MVFLSAVWVPPCLRCLRAATAPSAPLMTATIFKLAVLVAALSAAAAQSASPTPEASSSSSTATLAGQWVGVILLVISGGLFSGMTLGIMGLDTNQLQVGLSPGGRGK